MISQEDIDRFVEREEEHPQQYAKRDAAFKLWAESNATASYFDAFKAGWEARKRLVG